MSKFRENIAHEKERLEQTKEKLEETKDKLEEKLHAERTRKVMNVITAIGLVLVVIGCVVGWRVGLFTRRDGTRRIFGQGGPLGASGVYAHSDYTGGHSHHTGRG